jgi:FkbM family methyltransferase
MPTASSFYPESKRRLYKVRRERIVKALTLDAVLEKLNIKEVEWIKIDAEKADLDILLGSKTILQRSKRVKVIIEASSPRTFEHLRNIGFEVNSALHLAFKHAS